jgi:hypothetical protein
VTTESRRPGRPATGQKPPLHTRVPRAVQDAAKAKAKSRGEKFADVVERLLVEYAAEGPVFGSGELLMSGWIAPAPTGRDEAYLLLTTPLERARAVMSAIAEALDLRPGEVRQAPDGGATVRLRDGWAALVVGDDSFERPVSEEWALVARTRRQVVLCVGVAPMVEGMSVDDYTSHYGAEAAIGLVAVA